MDCSSTLPGSFKFFFFLFNNKYVSVKTSCIVPRHLSFANLTINSKSKIESVTDNIVSILQNDYFECIFSNILDDLKNNLGNRKVSLLLKDITEFDKEICKIAGFIFLEKYEKYREDYFANELKYYPNIRYKIYNLYEQRENREKLWHLSEKYCQRIEWHLYRLYRLRNAIVHAGESHKRIQMLGEHLHIYVDRVILELSVTLATSNADHKLRNASFKSC